MKGLGIVLLCACMLFAQDADVYEQILKKWVDYLTGNQTMQLQSPQEKTAWIAKIEKKAKEALPIAKGEDYLYPEYKNMQNGADVMATYARLEALAKAYVLPGSVYYHSKEIKEILLTSLQWLHDHAYKEGVAEYGNWWHWEIGIPKKLNALLAMLSEEIPKEKQIQYLKASQYFQPKAQYSGASPSAKYSSSPYLRISTGGNRLDTSMVSFIRGLLLKDKSEVLDGINAVPSVGEYVKSGDGFYPDCSFIQHDYVAYNGTYASVLFEGLGNILSLIKGTEFEFKDPRIDQIYRCIAEGYSMLFINGGITDAVSGRSISRDYSNEIERAKPLIQSIAILSEGAPKPHKSQLRTLLKKVLEENTAKNPLQNIDHLYAKEILKEIAKHEKLPPPQSVSKVFWGMDRVVHHGEKGAKFVLSMHSSRIANYESMNGENKRGWHTGDGMVYIYDKDSSKTKDFWPTVDLYHLSGTTESIKERKDFSGQRRTRTQLAPRAFAGGVSNGKVSFAGMDFISYNHLTQAKKSYFFYGDSMIAMGSNLSSLDGEIHTTLSNRDSHNDPFIYKTFLNPLLYKTQERKGTWREIGGKSTKEVKKEFLTAYINHGKNPKNAQYLYSVSLDPIDNIQVLSQNQYAHALKVAGYVAIHFWQDRPYSVDAYTSQSTLSLLAKEEGEILQLWVSDPTQSSKILSTLQIKGAYALLQTSDPHLQIQTTPHTTTLRIDLRQTGATAFIKLKKLPPPSSHP